MDPRYSAQNILLCDLCQKAALQSHCELCQVNLCVVCVEKHLSDSSKRHSVVPYKHKTYPKCTNHSRKHCEQFCENCDIPVCSLCISQGQHHDHKAIDILQKLESKAKDLKKDLNELLQRIFPTYKEIALHIKSEKASLERHYEQLTAAVSNQGEDLHREINLIVQKQKYEIDKIKTKQLASLDEQENEVKQKICDLTKCILDLKKILAASNVPLTFENKSTIAELKGFPLKVNVPKPRFSPQKINTEQLSEMFGSLSPLSITTEEHGYTMKTPEAVSCLPVKPLLDEPELITIIGTGHELNSVSCLNDEEIWTRGVDSIMRLYNLCGELLHSIHSKSKDWPCNIAVTRTGDLIYSDPYKRTVNIVENKKTHELIILKEWIPYYVCCSSSGDLLITMNSDVYKKSKVVRYSGTREKQTIHFDSEGKPLFSSGYYKYICENRNLDICVADSGDNSIVVVTQACKLRFRYTGHPSKSKKSFDPVGITTDSQSQILTADNNNHCIHILDGNGQFLQFIDNCKLYRPWGLCVDSRDNLFVAECNSGKVKKIRYM